MRIWTRATGNCFCGRCGLPIQAGDPVMQITVAGMAHGLRRCQACEAADEGSVPPPNLPPAGLAESTRSPIDLTRVGLLPLDFSKHR
jgi:hypothetical protein